MPEIRSRAVYNVPKRSRADHNMDITNILGFFGVLVYVGGTIYLANQEQVAAEHATLLRWLLFGMAFLTFMYGLFVLQTSLIPPSANLPLPQVDPTAAMVDFVLAAILSVFSAQIVASQALRERIRRLLPARASFDPESPVHTTACVLSLALICLVIGNFVVGGGIAGLAESIQANGVDFGDLLFEEVLWAAAAALGVGLFLRRTPEQTFTRLGLRLPTIQDIRWGSVIGLLLFGMVIVIGTLWTQFVSPQELQQQTAASDQLAQAFNSLPQALLISIVVAIGEEIFFRGALQPVFGNGLTSVFFTALHTQYALTPATILIFITSLTLGWLRNRQSTSATIIGHFVYNFIQLALALLAGTSV